MHYCAFSSSMRELIASSPRRSSSVQRLPILEERKLEFSCLVNYLKTRNISDEFLMHSSAVEDASACPEIINQYKLTIVNDAKIKYYDSRNVSWPVCKNITENSFCNSSINDSIIMKNENSINDQSIRECLGIEEGEKLQKDLSELYNIAKKKCEAIGSCFNCVNEMLWTVSDDYEDSMLHTKATNLTASVIEFRFWDYFKITTRVEELANVSNAFYYEAVNGCKSEGGRC